MFDPADYSIVVRKGVFDGEQCFEARVLELPDVAEYADTYEEAYELALDTIQITAEIFSEKGTWYVSTRGTAFAESGVNGWDITFRDMVMRSLGLHPCMLEDFQNLCNTYLFSDSTYICEITGMENRVVTRYEGYTLWLLGRRHNVTGGYLQLTQTFGENFGFETPKQFNFSSIEDCIETAKHLPDLQEGYVMYEKGVPICKVKSPAYVAVHRIRGEGLNPKRIAELVVINEQEEYLKYFPEDEKYFIPYIEALEDSLILAQSVFDIANQEVEQKTFALMVKDYPWFAFAFQARKSGEPNIKKCFNKQEANFKVKYLLGIVGELSA